jgi:branched-chain amino acid transport system substrate-binding protein
MTRKSPTNSARAGVTRRSFAAGAGAAGLLAGTAPFNIGRAQGGPLKIGVILPLSGVQAGIGQSCKRGADIAPALFKQIGYTQPIEIVVVDFETNVDTARARAERLIADGCNMLSGPFDSGAASAIAQVAEQKGVPFVINIAAAPQITEQGY